MVCSTCVGIGSDQLDGFTFAGVLLDEASQVPEPPASLQPFLPLNCLFILKLPLNCLFNPHMCARICFNAAN